MKLKFALLFLVCVGLAIATGSATAAPITVPSGLNPGDQYRLVFVTRATRTAFAPDIADYNAFVTNAANSVPELSALGTTWAAIASTATIAAKDNTNTNPSASSGVAIYTLADALFASSNVALWPNASSNSLPNAISFDEHGNFFSTAVWTGTQVDGSIAASHLGLNAGSLAVTGASTFSSGQWVAFGAVNNSATRPLYGLSGILTVVPEPSAIILECLAASGLVVASLRRRRYGKT
jgi:hypothetical protein